jgi:hypothetical protein
MDGLEHDGHLPALSSRDDAEDVAVEVYDASLPPGIRVEIADGLEQVLIPSFSARIPSLESRAE